MTSAPLSDVEIAAEITRISQRLDHQVTELAKRSRAAAAAEVRYKLEYARAVLDVEAPTVAERDAMALLACEDAYAAHKGAQAVLLAAQEAGRSMRAQADMLRTLAAGQRAALTYAEGVGS